MDETVYEQTGEMTVFVLKNMIEVVEAMANNAAFQARHGVINADRAGHLLDSAASLLRQAYRMDASNSGNPAAPLAEALRNEDVTPVDPYKPAAALMDELKSIDWSLHMHLFQ